jgi:1,4-dihydroxy-2-naphthoate octaprenyltransferase
VSTRVRQQQASSDPAVGPLVVWLGVLAGPLAWTAHLLVAYVLVGVACATGRGWPIHLVTLVAIVATVAGGVLAYRLSRRPDLTQGSHFAALAGVLLSAMFGFAIVMESLPTFGVGPCTNG